jgi:hypothetical protein
MNQPTPATDTTQPPRNGNHDTDAPPHATAVERLLADLAAGYPTGTPTGGTPGPGGASSTWSAQTAILCAYLEANPAASQAISALITDAWAAAEDNRSSYLIAVAKLRAEVLSHAELHHAVVAMPATTSQLREGLEEYLVHVRGRTIPELG